VLPKVSVIILNYNGVEDTLRCLKSLKNVNYSNFEVIVLDNGSSGDDSKILKDFSGLCEGKYRFIDNEKNLGFAGGCNRGIELVLKEGKSEYIYLLNNDTEVDSEFLIEAVKVALQAKKIGIVASKSLYFDNRNIVESAGLSLLNCGDMISRGRGKSKEKFNKDEELLGVCGAAMLIKCEVLREIGMFDEDYFLYSEDSDLSLRSVYFGWKCFFAHKSLIYHKVSATTSKSRGYDMSVRAQYNIFRAYFTNVPFFVFLLNLPFILIYWLFVPVFSFLFLRWKVTKVFCTAQYMFFKNLGKMMRKRNAFSKMKRFKSLHFWLLQRNFLPVYFRYFVGIVLRGRKSVLE